MVPVTLHSFVNIACVVAYTHRFMCLAHPLHPWVRLQVQSCPRRQSLVYFPHTNRKCSVQTSMHQAAKQTPARVASPAGKPSVSDAAKNTHTYTTCGIMRGFPDTSTSYARVCSTPLRFSWVSLSNEIGERCSLPRFGSRGTAAPGVVIRLFQDGGSATRCRWRKKRKKRTTQNKSNAQTSGRSHDALLSV